MPQKRRKQRCVVCRRSFVPDPKVRQRAVTCGDPNCQKERHKRQCTRWNRKNGAYFHANYLQKKLEQVQPALSERNPRAVDSVEGKRSSPAIVVGLPVDLEFGEINGWWRVVIEYILRVQIRHWPKTCGRCHTDLKGSPPLLISPSKRRPVFQDWLSPYIAEYKS
jgi:hypothetical protein